MNKSKYTKKTTANRPLASATPKPVDIPSLQSELQSTRRLEAKSKSNTAPIKTAQKSNPWRNNASIPKEKKESQPKEFIDKNTWADEEDEMDYSKVPILHSDKINTGQRQSDDPPSNFINAAAIDNTQVKIAERVSTVIEPKTIQRSILKAPVPPTNTSNTAMKSTTSMSKPPIQFYQAPKQLYKSSMYEPSTQSSPSKTLPISVSKTPIVKEKLAESHRAPDTDTSLKIEEDITPNLSIACPPIDTFQTDSERLIVKDLPSKSSAKSRKSKRAQKENPTPEHLPEKVSTGLEIRQPTPKNVSSGTNSSVDIVLDRLKTMMVMEPVKASYHGEAHGGNQTIISLSRPSKTIKDDQRCLAISNLQNNIDKVLSASESRVPLKYRSKSKVRVSTAVVDDIVPESQNFVKKNTAVKEAVIEVSEPKVAEAKVEKIGKVMTEQNIVKEQKIINAEPKSTIKQIPKVIGKSDLDDNWRKRPSVAKVKILKETLDHTKESVPTVHQSEVKKDQIVLGEAKPEKSVTRAPLNIKIERKPKNIVSSVIDIAPVTTDIKQIEVEIDSVTGVPICEVEAEAGMSHSDAKPESKLAVQVPRSTVSEDEKRIGISGNFSMNQDPSCNSHQNLTPIYPSYLSTPYYSSQFPVYPALPHLSMHMNHLYPGIPIPVISDMLTHPQPFAQSSTSTDLLMDHPTSETNTPPIQTPHPMWINFQQQQQHMMMYSQHLQMQQQAQQQFQHLQQLQNDRPHDFRVQYRPVGPPIHLPVHQFENMDSYKKESQETPKHTESNTREKKVHLQLEKVKKCV